MLTDKELNRINELAAKKKAEGLNEKELSEQAQLRTKFLDDFRSRFKKQLENIEIVDADDSRLKCNKPS